MNSSIRISTYESLRVTNSLITQNLHEWCCQVHIRLEVDPEGLSSISIYQKFRHYPREFYVFVRPAK